MRRKKMQRLRSYYDGDRENNLSAPTNYQSGQNQHELYCSICGDSYFVDDLIFENVNKLIKETLENPFICRECLEEYEELAHQ